MNSQDSSLGNEMVAGGTPDDVVNNVEFLVAYADNTWGTIIVDVPESVGIEREALVAWAERTLMRQAWCRDVVLIALYHICSRD